MRPVGPRPAGFAFGKAVGVAACTGRPTLGGLLVELLEDPPILYLNSGFTGLYGLLKDTRTRLPAEQALHDAVRMGVASQAWMGLLNTAIAGIQPGEDGEEPDWPTSDWQKSVLRSLLPRTYEGLSQPEGLRSAFEAKSPDAAAVLQSRALLAINLRLKAGAALRRGLRGLAEADDQSEEVPA